MAIQVYVILEIYHKAKVPLDKNDKPMAARGTDTKIFRTGYLHPIRISGL
jgi:hypothetical protein